MVEGGTELPQLILCKTHGVTYEYLVLHFVYATTNIGIQLAPGRAKPLQCRVGLWGVVGGVATLPQWCTLCVDYQTPKQLGSLG